jgi:hypothetical protein
VVLQIELAVALRVVLGLVGEEAQELAGQHVLDATQQRGVLGLLAGQTEGQVLAVHGALQESAATVATQRDTVTFTSNTYRTSVINAKKPIPRALNIRTVE